jgi:glycosyltransferase involved in cell wall biosynthesis
MKRINIVANNNGFGLTRHIRLIGEALRAGGFEVTVTSVDFDERGRDAQQRLRRKNDGRRRWLGWLGPRFAHAYDANIMIEHVLPVYFSAAAKTFYAPHPEWCWPVDAALLPLTNAALCMTHHAEPIFAARGCRTEYIGLTSEDRFDPAVTREQRFFHLAGASVNKGTETLLALWRRHPEWPTLVVVQGESTAKPGVPAANIDHRIGYIESVELHRLQNACRFHVCSSETEGYGHYLVEAMSVGAVVLTTDGPPMNEMITVERGLLVSVGHTGTQNLATTYFVSEAGLQDAVERALALDVAAADALGAAARAWFLENDAAFPARVVAALASLLLVHRRDNSSPSTR